MNLLIYFIDIGCNRAGAETVVGISIRGIIVVEVRETIAATVDAIGDCILHLYIAVLIG